MILNNLPKTTEANEYERLLEIYGFKRLAQKDKNFNMLYSIIKQEPKYMGALMKIFDAKWIDSDFRSEEPDKKDKDLYTMWEKMYNKFQFSRELSLEHISNALSTSIIQDHMMDMNDVRKCEDFQFKEEEIKKELIEAGKEQEAENKKSSSDEKSVVHEAKNYYADFDDEEELMVAEDQLEYNTTNNKWISVLNKQKPELEEHTLLCGYVYRGVIEYTVGTYMGGNEWDTIYDHIDYYPDYKVLYWMRIPEIPDIEEKYVDDDIYD